MSTDAATLDLGAFRAWYSVQCPGDLDLTSLSASMVTGGKSNLTYRLDDDGGRSRILRRPPLGPTQPSAHDMAREARILSALASSDVPVPQVLASCEDIRVLGAPFYVMDLVEGTVFRTAADLQALATTTVRHLISSELMGTLAKLHLVDPADVGLADLGPSSGYLERQLKRWGRQLETARTRELPDADKLLGRLVDLLELATRGSAVTLTHGDYRLDNVVVDHANEPRIRGVLDWEMATLGDPLADLGLLLTYDGVSAILGSTSLFDASTAPGYPTRDEQLQAYAEATGADLDPQKIAFHLALAHLKLAVIAEGIHRRHQAGNTRGSGFSEIGKSVEPLLRAGLDALRAPASQRTL